MRTHVQSFAVVVLLSASLPLYAQRPQREQRQQQRQQQQQGARSGGSCRPAVRIAGPEELVFSYSKQSCDRKKNYTDNRASGFIEADGQVSLLISNGDATYRMVGRNLNNVRLDCSASVMEHNPDSSDAGPQALWNDTYMHSPYTLDGKIIHMLIHNEYHGDGTKNPQANCGCSGNQCEARKPHCWYPSTAGAVSFTGGKHFHQVKGKNGGPQPAIASWYQYKAPGRPPFPRLQGVWYQTNIVSHKDDDGKTRYYVLISTALTDDDKPGHCVFRNENVADVRGWRGWDGKDWTVNMSFDPYKDQIPDAVTKNRCHSTGTGLGSFTFNQVAGQFLGPSDTKPGQNGSSVVLFSSSSDMLQWQDAGSITIPMNRGEGGKYAKSRKGEPFEVMYTSILDPKSEGRNFEYSGASPYLYFVRPAFEPNGHMGWENRDVYRIPLQVSCQ